MAFADASNTLLAGNLSAWPAEVPDAPGTYGLVLERGGSSTRIVASHLKLPGGAHLLIGRESARFQSLTDFFWYGIFGATAIVLLLGAAVGWWSRRALLANVQQISRDAAAIVIATASATATRSARPDQSNGKGTGHRPSLFIFQPLGLLGKL